MQVVGLLISGLTVMLTSAGGLQGVGVFEARASGGVPRGAFRDNRSPSLRGERGHAPEVENDAFSGISWVISATEKRSP